MKAGKAGNSDDDGDPVHCVIPPYRNVGMYGINALQKNIPSILNPSGALCGHDKTNLTGDLKEVWFVSLNHIGDHGPKVSAKELCCVLEAAITALPGSLNLTFPLTLPLEEQVKRQVNLPHHLRPRTVMQVYCTTPTKHMITRSLWAARTTMD